MGKKVLAYGTIATIAAYILAYAIARAPLAFG